MKVYRFYLGFIVPLALFLSAFSLSGLILTQAGEYLPMKEVVRKLEKTGGVFGSGLHSQAFWYKQATYRHFKPEITLLGSSRALLMRQEQFNAPFVSLGMMRSIDEEAELAYSLFDEHAPKLLMFDMDYWWFHERFETFRPKRTDDPAEVSLYELFKTIKWTISGKLPLGKIPHIISVKSPHLGMMGIIKGEGFDAHGSFWYHSSLTGDAEHKDPRFSATLAKLHSDDMAFARGPDISEKQWKTFEDLMLWLKAKDIKVILFIPPLAPTVFQAMEAEPPGSFAYIDALRVRTKKLVAAHGFSFFDFHDSMGTIGSDNCEFVDGIHGGIVTYTRMLLHMAERHANLRAYTDVNAMRQEISTHKGHASLLGSKETDFLKIGCLKDKGQ